MKTIDAEVSFTPPTDELRFLPEGPYRKGDGVVSWVGIQHGADSTVGSLNLLNLTSGINESFGLPGRPGFAFPTTKPTVFVVGMERSVVLFDIADGTWETLAEGIDSGVENTIINDGMISGENLIFGCKDLEFATKKAGLYLLQKDGQLTQLANDQVCSNGKAIRADGDRLTFFDICSCAKQVVSWTIDFEARTITDQKVVADLTSESVAPDGMILTPDEKSLIVAIFNPGDADHGEARQYSIETGEVEAIWRCDASPRVTCPQLVQHEGKVKLLLTTADEGMEPELRQKSKNAGCLFIAETDFTSLNENPIWSI